VVGYEVGIRVGEFLGRSHYRVFHTTGTAGTLAAAAAVGHCAIKSCRHPGPITEAGAPCLQKNLADRSGGGGLSYRGGLGYDYGACLGIFL
jgi:hypothetical protein